MASLDDLFAQVPKDAQFAIVLFPIGKKLHVASWGALTCEDVARALYEMADNWVAQKCAPLNKGLTH